MIDFHKRMIYFEELHHVVDGVESVSLLSKKKSSEPSPRRHQYERFQFLRAVNV